ncbi:MAG: bifunctional DNA-formamidopyrimidine glycosylase/DNA-(apurinic or apyrimidinic site) lyase [Candidatus Melainabacteria bacterium]|nr:bifunctional DNA-formamidopyrimidine glycosylase/DNA-(apurinic or apyrimidinic site) lyase [Candidatus Melainabacteria bacterium]
MPELPEVETVCRGIAPQIEGRSISRVKVNCKKLRIPIPKKFASILKGRKIIRVKRKAKYIVIELDSGYSLVIHLGMSGRLTIQQDYQPAKHDHIVIELDNGSLIVFNDTRKFGLATVLHETEFDDFKFFKKLGIEPLSKELNTVQLFKILEKRKKNIKSVIMDSSIIVGVGNIYASESLFSAGIHPERLASEISKKESDRLFKAIVETLKRAIEAGGSTLKDYAKANGESGYFQHQFLVYDQQDQPCSKCKRAIQKIKQNGRATYFCGKCQK